MVIAIDGPAGSGKSTIANLISKKLSITFLNSGSFYRALTLALLQNKINLANENEVLAFCKTQTLDYKNAHLILNGIDVEDQLHNDEVSANVAQISSIVGLRHLVNERLREITKSLSIVCEGRDMTTVVFPNADYKFFLDASLDVQAERRFNQGVSKLSLAEIREAIQKRDTIDRNKSEGALVRAKDAIYIDTSRLTIEQVCEIILDKIKLKGSDMEKEEVAKEQMQDSDEKFQTQLDESLSKLNPPEDGDIVDGKIISVSDDTVFVDVNCKSEGRLSKTEFGDSEPKVGDTVTVKIIKVFGKMGPEISKKAADEKRLWKAISNAKEKNLPVEGTISKVVKGGFEVDLGGDYHAFLPISQSDVIRVQKPESMLGLKSQFYIERLYSENKPNIVVNRRKFLEETTDKARDEFFNTVNIGDTVKGEVKSFTSFGAFIDLGGFDGLLHINDMSWGHVARPKDFVKKNQEIELKVIRLDPETKRINLSLKHFHEDPWMHFEDKYHVNDIVSGTVTKLTDFGAFIELEEGIEGLVHISEFSWTKKIDKPSDVVKLGDKVECMILGYDIQAGRVSLGLKQVTANPWDSISEKFPAGTRCKGKVAKVTNAGAFITIDEGIDGFLHSDDISWTKKVKYPGSELKVDDEIDVIVLDCDAEHHRIKLGIKQLTENPWEVFAQAHPAGSTFQGEVSSITEFGVFVKAENGIEGLVNKANLSEERSVPFEEAVKKYKEGDKINVYVVDVNVAKEKAAFSVREFKKAEERQAISQYMSQADENGSYTVGDFMQGQKQE